MFVYDQILFKILPGKCQDWTGYGAVAAGPNRAVT